MKWKDSNDGVETVADEEGSFEEDYSPLRTRKRNSGSRLASIFTRPGSWLVTIPVLLLVIFLFSIRPGGSNKVLLKAMDQRLQQIESRMATLEGISERVTDLDKDRQAAQPLTVRLDRIESSFSKRIGEIDNKLKKLQAKLVSTKAKQAQAPVVKSRTSKQASKTHVVKKGETLYSISKQYGLSVSQLMIFNKLSKGSVINPGQSLKISP
jgi:LysM repeat protein